MNLHDLDAGFGHGNTLSLEERAALEVQATKTRAAERLPRCALVHRPRAHVRVVALGMVH
jgi:hypothetical protein